MSTMEAEDIEVLLTLDMLPADATLAVLEHLDPLDVCRCSRISRAFSSACRDKHLWAALLDGRGVHEARAASAFHGFQAYWLGVMDRINSIGMDITPGGAASAAVPQQSAGLVASAPQVCGSSQSIQMQVGNHGVDPKEFLAAVRKIERIVSTVGGGPHDQTTGRLEALPRGHLWLTDWLRTGAAQQRPLLCLAILAVMQKEAPQRWLAPCEADQEFEAEDKCSWRKTAARKHLLESPWSPPPSLQCQVTLRWDTWSQLRDCRGFRARDDRHRRSATLLELCQKPEADFWAVLARGEGHEISKLRLHSEL